MKLGHGYGEVQIDIHRLYVCTIMLELREVSIRPKGKRSGIRWLFLVVHTFFFYIFLIFFIKSRKIYMYFNRLHGREKTGVWKRRKCYYKIMMMHPLMPHAHLLYNTPPLFFSVHISIGTGGEERYPMP